MLVYCSCVSEQARFEERLFVIDRRLYAAQPATQKANTLISVKRSLFHVRPFDLNSAEHNGVQLHGLLPGNNLPLLKGQMATSRTRVFLSLKEIISDIFVVNRKCFYDTAHVCSRSRGNRQLSWVHSILHESQQLSWPKSTNLCYRHAQLFR